MSRYLLSTALLVVSFIGHAATIAPGHTGVWRNIERSGEGVTLEILGATTASMVWFTYDGEGNPRWAYGLGTIVRDDAGDRIEFPDLFRSTGGRFSAAYDPSTVSIERVGRATFRFEDCNSGEFVFDAFGQLLEIQQQRLTAVMAANCTSPIHGLPGDVVYAYAGQSGVWNDPTRFGQGLQLQWTSSNAPGIGWYTFDASGNPYWLTGLGRLEGSPASDGTARIVIPMLYAPRGARFGDAYDPADVELVEWGSAELLLTCGTGVLRYQSNVPGFGSGEREIRLLTRSVPAACPWSEPRLTDLYDIEFEELTIAPPTNADRNAIRVVDLADDGTVVAYRPEPNRQGNQVLRRRAGHASWEVVGDRDFGPTATISSSGETIYANYDPKSSGSVPLTVQRWTESAGWQSIPEFVDTFYRSGRMGSSPNGSQLVGLGAREGQASLDVWTWGEAQGIRLLPANEDEPGFYPVTASNDGRRVAGYFVGSNVDPILGFPRNYALLSHDGSRPERMKDTNGVALGNATACSLDCSVVFGFDQEIVNFGNPNFLRPWWWKNSAQSSYLALPPDGYSTLAVAESDDVGSIVVGSYLPPVSVEFSTEAFLWTQNTGPVSIGTLLSEQGLAQRWWRRFAVGVSSDGRTILLGGYDRLPSGLAQQRAALLHLLPKETPSDAAIKD